MEYWLGEKKYIRTVAEGDTAFTVSSVKMTIYDSSGTKVVDDLDGIDANPGSFKQHELRYLWEPTAIGTYEAAFKYVVGSEAYKHVQKIFVKALP